MIFDGRPIADITDGEILGLVEKHLAERRHLEFKLTVNHQVDDDRLELLLDVASLANAGGGYVIVGVRDDGKGRAQRFENPGDTTRIARSIRDLCLEHVVDRIDGLEVQERVVAEHKVIVLRVPTSTRVPHMVTFNRGTHFVTRYDDGKREMTLAEIRDAMVGDLLHRRLLAIQESVQHLGRELGQSSAEEIKAGIAAGIPRARLQASNGKALSDAELARFREEVG